MAGGSSVAVAACSRPKQDPIAACQTMVKLMWLDHRHKANSQATSLANDPVATWEYMLTHTGCIKQMHMRISAV